jgi:hypothetical protein
MEEAAPAIATPAVTAPAVTASTVTTPAVTAPAVTAVTTPAIATPAVTTTVTTTEAKQTEAPASEGVAPGCRTQNQSNCQREGKTVHRRAPQIKWRTGVKAQIGWKYALQGNRIQGEYQMGKMRMIEMNEKKLPASITVNSLASLSPRVILCRSARHHLCGSQQHSSLNR